MCRWLFPVRLFRYARANMAACIMRHRDAGKDLDAGSTVLDGPLRVAVRSVERAEEERAGEPVSNSVRPDRWDFDVLISGMVFLDIVFTDLRSEEHTSELQSRQYL